MSFVPRHLPAEATLPAELVADARAWRDARIPALATPIRWALGLGTWVAGSFFATALFVLEPPEALLVALGIVLAAVSCAASRFELPLVARPPVLVAAVLARALVATSEAEQLGMLALEIAFVLFHKDPLHRAAATFLAWCLLFPAFEIDLDGVAVLALPATALGAGLLVTRRHWLGTRLFRPLAAIADGTAAFALVAPIAALVEEGWGWAASATVGVAAVAVSGTVAASVGLRPRHLAMAVVGPAAIAAATHAVPGVQVAIVLAVLAFATRHGWLWGASVAAIAGYGAFFYYDLDLPLWWKGSALVASGLVLLAIGRLAGRSR